MIIKLNQKNNFILYFLNLQKIKKLLNIEYNLNIKSFILNIFLIIV